MSIYSSTDYDNTFVIAFPVDNEAGCHAFEGDELKISIDMNNDVALSYNAKVSKSADYAKLWTTKTGKFDEKHSIITGTLDSGDNLRHFSIALDRSTTKPFRIHVYVSKRAVGGPAPDDGTWNGVGR